MNTDILEKYNTTVTDKDEVYFLGDLTMDGPSNQEKFVSLFSSLPGKKHLILGNHDKFKPFSYHDMGFFSVHTSLRVSLTTKLEIYMVHDPAWAQISNSVWLCGHVHQQWKSQRVGENTLLINVGVDAWDFFPVILEDILLEFDKYNIEY